ncbi:hypothetical protein [Streptomyces sp. KR80]|uniref:hypothetical protein n=1 Tax=Streptomyces sp. KR80 TaxID=3457426 RepID=UPI003FD05566
MRVLDLLDQALTEQTGGVFQGANERLQRAVDVAKERYASWRPVKAAVEYLDVVPDPVTDERLTAWLTEREDSFPAWAEKAGDPAGWDFSVDSLDVLETLVEKRYSDAEFRTAREAGDPFLQGAAWYLGEVCRRHRGGRWQYRAARPDATPGDWYSAHSRWTETPYVWVPLRQHGRALFPMGTLWVLVAEEEYEGEFGYDITLRRAIR